MEWWHLFLENVLTLYKYNVKWNQGLQLQKNRLYASVFLGNEKTTLSPALAQTRIITLLMGFLVLCKRYLSFLYVLAYLVAYRPDESAGLRVSI